MKNIHKIFISYSRQDKNIVYSLKNEIEERLGNGSCWIDITGIESDKQFVDVIIDAIDHADIFLFMYSANSEKSEWSRKEVDYAYNENKKIVFIQIDNTPLGKYYLFMFKGHDIIDISDKYQKKKLLDNLFSWIGGNPMVEKSQSYKKDKTWTKAKIISSIEIAICKYFQKHRSVFVGATILGCIGILYFLNNSSTDNHKYSYRTEQKNDNNNIIPYSNKDVLNTDIIDINDSIVLNQESQEENIATRRGEYLYTSYVDTCITNGTIDQRSTVFNIRFKYNYGTIRIDIKYRDYKTTQFAYLSMYLHKKHLEGLVEDYNGKSTGYAEATLTTDSDYITIVGNIFIESDNDTMHEGYIKQELMVNCKISQRTLEIIKNETERDIK